MSLLQFTCPHCQGVFQVDDSMAGQTVACPHCQGHVQVGAVDIASVPPATSEPPTGAQVPSRPQFPGTIVGSPSPATDAGQHAPPPRPGQLPVEGAPADATASKREKFEITCPRCGGVFRSSASMVGQQVMCPMCSARLIAPAAGQAAALVPESSPRPLSPSPPGFGGSNRPILVEKPTEPTPEASPFSLQEENSDADASSKHRTAATAVQRITKKEEVVDPTLVVKEPETRLVKVGDQMVEIRRLSPEEKAARRFRRNIVMVVVGALILLGVMYYLTL